MSDIILPLSNPVYLTSLQDVDLIDLYSRYGVLARAYEALVKQSKEEKRMLEHQLRSLSNLIESSDRGKNNHLVVRPTIDETVTITELECKCKELQDSKDTLEATLEEQRKTNDDLQKDLSVAIAEGIKYRDSLKKMIEIREIEEKRAVAKKAKSDAESHSQVAALATLQRMEKALAIEKEEAKNQRNKNGELINKLQSEAASRRSLEIENERLNAKISSLESTLKKDVSGQDGLQNERSKAMKMRVVQLEEICSDVKTDLSNALSIHENWKQVSGLQQQLVTIRGSEILEKEPPGSRNKRLPAGITTPARSVGDSIFNNTIFNSSVAFATPVSLVAGDSTLTPATPDVDHEEWKHAIQQYEAADQGSVEDFILVNKRFSTAHVIVFDGLLSRHKDSIKRIDLSYNYLRNSGIISLTPLFRSIPNLSHLDCGDNHIGDTGAAALAEFLSSSTKLTILALGGNKISDAGLSSIAAVLPKTLQTLNLNFNLIGGDGVIALSRALPASKLSVIYLDGNRINAAGILALGNLAESDRIILRQLHLRGNPGLVDLEAKSSVEALAKRHPSLNLFI